MFKLIKSMFSSDSDEEAVAPDGQPIQSPRVPDGVRVYVIGDIHGRLDLLHSLHEQISNELRQLPAPRDAIVVYLGDYIDRGSDSFGVVELLLKTPIEGCRQIYLRGNHESEMDGFLAAPKPNHVWTQCGGMETALSYKVRVKAQVSAVDRVIEMRDQLLELIPAEHRRFYSELQLNYEIGDYFMVHAGVRPGVPLAQQRHEDMLWIRGPFLSYTGQFGKVVVHGHTVTPQPIILPNRIGIDTGAYHSGKLTSVVLEEDQIRFLST